MINLLFFTRRNRRIVFFYYFPLYNFVTCILYEVEEIIVFENAKKILSIIHIFFLIHDKKK